MAKLVNAGISCLRINQRKNIPRCRFESGQEPKLNNKTIEQWEKELRKKLDKEIPDGMYKIGMDPMVAIADKQGKIDFEVMLVKMSKMLNKEAIKKWGKPNDRGVTSKENSFSKTIIELRNKCKP